MAFRREPMMIASALGKAAKAFGRLHFSKSVKDDGKRAVIIEEAKCPALYGEAAAGIGKPQFHFLLFPQRIFAAKEPVYATKKPSTSVCSMKKVGRISW